MRTVLRIGAALLAVVVICVLLATVSTSKRQNALAKEPIEIFEAEVQSFAQSAILTLPPSSETQILLKLKIMEVDREKLVAQKIGLFDFLTPSSSNETTSGQPDTRPHVAPLSKREVELFTDLVRATNVAKVLAEPTLVTTEGRPASFINGNEIPIVITHDGDARNVEYRLSGTSVKVTPTTLSDGLVRLEVKYEQSELDDSLSANVGGPTVPALRTRQIDTSFEVEPGKTVLCSNRDNMLLVMVTPEVVEPMMNHEPAQPSAIPSAETPVSVDTPYASEVQALSPITSTRRNRLQATASNSPRISMTSLVFKIDEEMLDKHGVDLFKALSPTQQSPDEREIASTIDARKLDSLVSDLKGTPGAELLSQPELLATSGTAANINVGKRILIPKPDGSPPDEGDYHHVGLEVRLVPDALRDGKIHLAAHLVHSQLGAEERSIESIEIVRRAELYAGETLVVYEKVRNILVLVTPRILAHETSVYPSPDYARTLSPATSAQPKPTPLASPGSKKQKLEQPSQSVEQQHPRVVDHSQPDTVKQPKDSVRHTVSIQSNELEQPMEKVRSINDELRELRKDVSELRLDVGRLIDILEDHNSISDKSESTEDDHSSTTALDIDEVAWNVIGISIEKVEVDSTRYRGGLKILKVRSESPAEAEGIQIGDVLVGLDKWETTEPTSLHYVLSRLHKDNPDKLKCYILREGETLYGNLKFTETLIEANHGSATDVTFDERIAS